MANRLVSESSPYLLQHAENPVDWYPWGDEAFDRARAEDKPILLSIGYSACHWCHVMAHESFEDQSTAALMNQHFVNIKVDREERPDVDAVYMEAVQALTGSGGWPMTVFLTPDGRPFYAGTYFPPADRFGMPGFSRVLASVAAAYSQQRSRVVESAGQIAEFLRQAQRNLDAPPDAGRGARPNVRDRSAAAAEPAYATLDRAAGVLLDRVDWTHGGFGAAPKFPAPLALEFLLAHHYRTQDDEALRAVTLTLARMAAGGVYDQLGGGFHRYSVDARWLVPHFEKMLYDNALLSRLYLLAYQATGDAADRRVAEETLDYVRRELTSPEGGFYSTQDADSEGEEGKYYAWTPAELAAVLGPADAAAVGTYYGVTERGNFDGKNVLYRPLDLPDAAARAGLSEEGLAERVAAARPKLLAARARRVPPGRDEKVLTAWNGLMLRSFALAAATLGRDDYLDPARASGEFILSRLRVGGQLRRTYRNGQARIPGYLEDYAAAAAGLIALYEATFELRWLVEARGLAEELVERFWDEADGAFYDTGPDHDALIVRPRGLADSATPSGAALATDTLLRLGALTGDGRHAPIVRRVLSGARELLAEHPSSFGQLLVAQSFYLTGATEVAIAGGANPAETQALVAAARAGYRPNQVTALRPAGAAVPEWLGLLEGREARGGRATAYVCRGFVCERPATSAEELGAQLAGARAALAAASAAATTASDWPATASADPAADEAAPGAADEDTADEIEFRDV